MILRVICNRREDFFQEKGGGGRGQRVISDVGILDVIIDILNKIYDSGSYLDPASTLRECHEYTPDQSSRTVHHLQRTDGYACVTHRVQASFRETLGFSHIGRPCRSMLKDKVNYKRELRFFHFGRRHTMFVIRQGQKHRGFWWLCRDNKAEPKQHSLRQGDKLGPHPYSLNKS